METIIDYSTLNLAITTTINGRQIIVHVPPPSKDVLKKNSNILGTYYAKIRSTYNQGMLQRDWESFIDDAIETKAEHKYPNAEPEAKYRLDFIKQSKTYISEMLEFAISLAYVIDGDNVEKYSQTPYYAIENITEYIKGSILFFIATARYISNMIDMREMTGNECAYISQDAMDYAITLSTQQTKPETLEK